MISRKSKKPASRRLKVYIISAVMGIAASIAALLLFSIILFLLKLPIAHSGTLSFIVFGTGCLFSGFFAGAMKRQGGLEAGVKAALLFTISVIVCGFIIRELFDYDAASSLSPQIFNKVVTAIVCGAVGGVFGVNKNGGF